MSAVDVRDTFTTGEAAKVLRLSQQSIIRCLDKGLLNGWRVPGSKFRRTTSADLMAFAKDNNIPTDLIEQEMEKRRSEF